MLINKQRKESVMTNRTKEETMFQLYKEIMCLETMEQIDEVQGYLKTRKKDLGRSTISSLAIRDNVLVHSNGNVERGVLLKINRTRAVVDIENKGAYNVPFSMIRKES